MSKKANTAGAPPVGAAAQDAPKKDQTKTVRVRCEAKVRKNRKTGEALVLDYWRRPRTKKPKVPLTLDAVLKLHVWSVGHYAFYLGISPGAVRNQIDKDLTAPYIKVGKQIRFNRDDVLAWVSGQTKGAIA
jgi:Helix-turn-helix domain